MGLRLDGGSLGDDQPVREAVLKTKGSKFYYIKSEEDLIAEREADIAAGRVLDDAGEPRLYSKIATSSFPEDTLITITRRRGVPWPHWRKKPTHLVEGLATIRGIPRMVMFVWDARSRGNVIE